MNKLVPRLPRSWQPDRCVLVYDNAPIHTADADDCSVITDVFPLRLPHNRPEVQHIEAVSSEYSRFLQSAHHLFQTKPEALSHALTVCSLRMAGVAFHSKHSLLKAVRLVPELTGVSGVWQNAFEPLPWQGTRTDLLT